MEGNYFHSFLSLLVWINVLDKYILSTLSFENELTRSYLILEHMTVMTILIFLIN